MLLLDECFPFLVILGTFGDRNTLSNSVIGKIDQVGELVQGQVVPVPGVADRLFEVTPA